MKKIISFLLLALMLTFVMNSAYATTETQNPEGTVATTDVSTETPETGAEAVTTEVTEVPEEEEATFHYVLLEKFLEGGFEFMLVILICLLIGLALSIERIIYLNLSTTNTHKLLLDVEKALETGGVPAAKEVCRNTKGPVASIYYQGLDRFDQGLDVVEKSIVSYGSVLMGRLESNLTWIALFIALAPMLGFMGTVIGMIGAFDDIAKAGDISPQIVADGIKMALLTTVFGLIVAVILQVFYNYILSKIDSLVNSMENATISFMDLIIKHNK